MPGHYTVPFAAICVGINYTVHSIEDAQIEHSGEPPHFNIANRRCTAYYGGVLEIVWTVPLRVPSAWCLSLITIYKFT